MSWATKRLAQKLIAIFVIVAILGVIGFSTAIIIFFLIVGVVFWRTVRRSESQETERVFEFYIAADEVLRDEGRQWYGFEIAEVIDSGEKVVLSLPDCPPVIRFALGALCHRVGEFETAVEHLSWVTEDSFSNEVHQTSPSPQLRRYVETLRRIEREPAMAPQTLAAVRNLERSRRKRAADLLAESRERLKDPSRQGHTTAHPASAEGDKTERTRKAKPLSLITAPPPISEVLHEIYQSEDKKTA
jgi:hypothetical protein